MTLRSICPNCIVFMLWIISYKANQKDHLRVNHHTTSDVDVTSRPFQFHPSSSSSSSSVVFTSELSVCHCHQHHVGEECALAREQKLPSVRTHRGVFRRRCATRLLHRYEIGSVATDYTRRRRKAPTTQDGLRWIKNYYYWRASELKGANAMD